MMLKKVNPGHYIASIGDDKYDVLFRCGSWQILKNDSFVQFEPMLRDVRAFLQEKANATG